MYSCFSWKLIHWGTISWRYRLQEHIYVSITKPRYLIASEAIKESMWLSRPTAFMGVTQHVSRLFCDNHCLGQESTLSCKVSAYWGLYHSLHLRWITIKSIFLEKVVSLENVSLRKALPLDAFGHYCCLMGIFLYVFLQFFLENSYYTSITKNAIRPCIQDVFFSNKLLFLFFYFFHKNSFH